MEKTFRDALERLARGPIDRMVDLHTHTFLSDGELLPMELIRRREARGDLAVGISDHVSYSNYRWVIEATRADCRVANEEMDIIALPGVEITHVPPSRIPELARLCLEAGALYVVVHGESPVEPVKEGTDLAAACEYVDILAHPGNIPEEAVKACVDSGVALEITARSGHSRGNPTVASRGLKGGATFIVNTDAHRVEDSIDREEAERIALKSGLPEDVVERTLKGTPAYIAGRVLERAKRMRDIHEQ